MLREDKLKLFESIDMDRLIALNLLNLEIPGFAISDLKQEARLIAWKSLEKYDPNKSQLNTFLSTVVRNHLIKLLIKSQAQKRKSIQFVPEEIKISISDHPNYPDFEKEHLERERIRLVRNAIDKAKESLGEPEKAIVNCYLGLDPSLRDTINSCKQKRMSNVAIAKHLGITIDRFATAIGRIKKAMRSAKKVYA